MPFPAACFPKANTTLQGAGFDPLGIGSLTDWLDYRPVAASGNGNPVSTWTGRKGVLVMTASGTSRGTWVDNDGDGRGAVQFDGVNDLLAATISNAALYGTTGDFEIWTFTRLSATQAYNGALWTSEGSTNQMGCRTTSSSNLQVFIPNGAQLINVSATMQDDVWHVLRIQKQGASRLIQLDGTTIYNASTVAGTYGTGSDILYLGGGFGHYMAGGYRHWLAFNSPLDNTTAAQLTSYLTSA